MKVDRNLRALKEIYLHFGWKHLSWSPRDSGTKFRSEIINFCKFPLNLFSASLSNNYNPKIKKKVAEVLQSKRGENFFPEVRSSLHMFSQQEVPQPNQHIPNRAIKAGLPTRRTQPMRSARPPRIQLSTNNATVIPASANSHIAPFYSLLLTYFVTLLAPRLLLSSWKIGKLGNDTGIQTLQVDLDNAYCCQGFYGSFLIFLKFIMASSQTDYKYMSSRLFIHTCLYQKNAKSKFLIFSDNCLSGKFGQFRY